MNWQDEQIAKAMTRAVTAARAGYEFSGNAYSYAAYVECLRARDAANAKPDWIAAYLAYQEA